MFVYLKSISAEATFKSKKVAAAKANVKLENSEITLKKLSKSLSLETIFAT